MSAGAGAAPAADGAEYSEKDRANTLAAQLLAFVREEKFEEGHDIARQLLELEPDNALVKEYLPVMTAMAEMRAKEAESAGAGAGADDDDDDDEDDEDYVDEGSEEDSSDDDDVDLDDEDDEEGGKEADDDLDDGPVDKA